MALLGCQARHRRADRVHPRLPGAGAGAVAGRGPQAHLPRIDRALTRPLEGDPRGATALLDAARASGRRELEISGRRFVEVSFGDFPYVVRFTPRDDR